MRVKRFRVTNFRSVKDSGWIEIDDVTSMIGVNESGKTNLLLPLWKFRPAQEGEIIPTADYPKKMFGEIRDAPGQYKFVEVDLDCSAHSVRLSELTGYPAEQLTSFKCAKHYDGKYRWELPDIVRPMSLEAPVVSELLASAATSVAQASALKGEVESQSAIGYLFTQLASETTTVEHIGKADLQKLAARIKAEIPAEPMKTSVIAPITEQIAGKISALSDELESPLPNDIDGVWKFLFSKIPRFVYYSNYGNLDSEIYLPHVVENLGREDLGAKEAAKARTLRVLFKFVKLEPKEILELGQEFKDPTSPMREPTAEEAEKVAIKKKERSILLQSAGARLTQRFREWWNQGDYRFRFEADGNHFRIWVSDDLRSEEIELENRSTGLQWFLSFYLVFLVESLDAHENAFLLLDEPGLSLHPLAQKDLSSFFDSLASANQLIYTTHSPFLIDPDRLDRARKVFVNSEGATEATPDLRATGGKRQEGAAYAVYSALNLSVAESLLLGCAPVIVEGASDQHYLTMIKTLLIGAGKIAPVRELVFPPSGGVRTAKAIAGMLGGRDAVLPKMLLDGDRPGIDLANNAKQNLYAGDQEKIALVTDFFELKGAEIEDMIDAAFLASVVDRRWRQSSTLFADAYIPANTIVGQIEVWAEAEHIELGEGWKVDLARDAKQLGLSKGIGAFSQETVARWTNLFEWLSA